ncbi:GNAT family N-acetyltransferase [Rhodothermaceae bacterium RA]|nr:GNAT family N-acetyltransferase [Rhodothermaceae bacterium RA]
MDVQIQVAQPAHAVYAEAICQLIEEAARARGTGIAKRDPNYIRRKIEEGKAVIALDGDRLAGFCYIETWSHDRYVANSGLIVAPDYRQMGLAKRIKRKIFELSRQKYPDAKIFGITTSLAVMKINSELGYKPVTFSELTTDDAFWDGCQSCPNYDVLTRTNRKICLCTGMLFDPAQEAQKKAEQRQKRHQQQKRQQQLKAQQKRLALQRRPASNGEPAEAPVASQPVEEPGA